MGKVGKTYCDSYSWRTSTLSTKRSTGTSESKYINRRRFGVTESKDPKERFKEALEKKRAANAPKNKSLDGKSKVQGGQSSGGAPKMFRRKSGSS
jgi:hypothetical protein